MYVSWMGLHDAMLPKLHCGAIFEGPLGFFFFIKCLGGTCKALIGEGELVAAGMDRRVLVVDV